MHKRTRLVAAPLTNLESAGLMTYRQAEAALSLSRGTIARYVGSGRIASIHRGIVSIADVVRYRRTKARNVSRETP